MRPESSAKIRIPTREGILRLGLAWLSGTAAYVGCWDFLAPDRVQMYARGDGR